MNPSELEVCDDLDNDCDGLTDDADDSRETTADEVFYPDTDGDGYGDPNEPVAACEPPEAYVEDDTDCEDSDPNFHPGAEEYCDQDTDYNCDGTTQYEDSDGDGVPACNDCDDSNRDAYPGAPEACDGADNDCDSDTDEDDAIDATLWYRDADEDGFGDETLPVAACEQPEGYVSADPGFDCDDTVPTTFPGAPEVCDGFDHDCDGLVLEDDSTDASVWYVDTDGDGYGTDVSTLACLAPSGTSAYTGDCDDTSSLYNPAATELCTDTVDYNCDESTGDEDADEDGFVACEDCDDGNGDAYPGAPETCDGVDNNCDEVVDESDTLTWYLDSDGDDYGDETISVSDCAKPSGYVEAPTGENGFDCDDSDSAIRPDAPEYCGEVDYDCDGATDEANSQDALTFYADIDGDTFGNAEDTATACSEPEAYVSDSADCDDTDPLLNPDALEICDDLDNDCDSRTDIDATDALDWYADSDEDGFGDPDVVETACDQPGAFVGDATDCDDTDGGVNPAADDVCDGLDNDCTNVADDDPASFTMWYTDGDGDGHGDVDLPSPGCDAPLGTVGTSDDCDDSDAGYWEDADGDGTCDHVPAAPSVTITPASPADTDDLVCTATATDEDGDSLTYSYVWSVNGLDSGITGDSVAADITAEGEIWTCTATASDATDEGPPGDASATILGEGYTTVWGSELLEISAGTYNMGGGLSDTDDEYQDHSVTLTHDFWIGRTEVTRAQWESFGDNAGWPYLSVADGWAGTSESPADSTSWEEIAVYANALSVAEGLPECYLSDGSDIAEAYVTNPYDCPGYRMPTEAEWEYAARAGEDTIYAGSNTIGDVAWYYDNALALGIFAPDVGGLAPNAHGLYDMSGNLYEWTGDRWASDSGGYGDGGAETDPAGDADSPFRVLRGGAWSVSEEYSRIAFRTGSSPSAHGSSIGFRLARTVAPDTIPSVPTVSISPAEPYNSDALTCLASSSDPQGDEISYTYAWTVDGLDAGIAESTVPADVTHSEEVWTCSVTASDGVQTTAAASATVTVTRDPIFDYENVWGTEMIAIPAGTFTMGGGLGDVDSSYKDHDVTLTHDFWIGQTELTRTEWEGWSENAGWTYQTGPGCTNTTGVGQCPADLFTWWDLAEYANALSVEEGLTACYLSDGSDLDPAYLLDPSSCPGYRLPTEAEWERAARADENTVYAGSDTLAEVAWSVETSGGLEHEVAQLAPNAWGLYDMSGNMMEWTGDWYDGEYGGYDDGFAATDPPGPSSGTLRACRGGQMQYGSQYVTVTYREYASPTNFFNTVGARLVRSSIEE